MTRSRRTRIVALLAATTAAFAVSTAAATAQTTSTSTTIPTSTTPTTTTPTSTTNDDIVLVSNKDLSGRLYYSLSAERHQYGQAFTTGSATGGFTLTQIEVGAWGYYPWQGNSPSAATSIAVSVRSDDNGKPGTVLASTTADIARAANSSDYTNTAVVALDTALALSADTKYWVVYGSTDDVTWVDMIYDEWFGVSYRLESSTWAPTSTDSLAGWSLSSDLLARTDPGHPEWPGAWRRVTAADCVSMLQWRDNACPKDLHGRIELTGRTGGVGGV